MNKVTSVVCFISMFYNVVSREKGSVIGKRCSFRFHYKEHTFQSPGYPDFYPNNATCVWKIAAEKGWQVVLTVIDFRIEDSKHCIFDSVTIYDGEDDTALPIQKYCGDTKPGIIKSISNILTIVMMSDETINGKGFQMKYRLQPDCRKSYSSLSGNIQSPGYPVAYPDQLYCTYHIVGSEGAYIKITIEDFDLEERQYYDCFDQLSIFTVTKDAHENLIGQYCGRNINKKHFCIKDKSVTIRFVTDDGIHYKGFKLHYKKSAEVCDEDEAKPVVTLPNAVFLKDIEQYNTLLDEELDKLNVKDDNTHQVINDENYEFLLDVDLVDSNNHSFNGHDSDRIDLIKLPPFTSLATPSLNTKPLVRNHLPSTTTTFSVYSSSSNIPIPTKKLGASRIMKTLLDNNLKWPFTVTTNFGLSASSFVSPNMTQLLRNVRSENTNGNLTTVTRELFNKKHFTQVESVIKKSTTQKEKTIQTSLVNDRKVWRTLVAVKSSFLEFVPSFKKTIFLSELFSKQPTKKSQIIQKHSTSKFSTFNRIVEPSKPIFLSLLPVKVLILRTSSISKTKQLQHSETFAEKIITSVSQTKNNLGATQITNVLHITESSDEQNILKPSKPTPLMLGNTEVTRKKEEKAMPDCTTYLSVDVVNGNVPLTDLTPVETRKLKQILRLTINQVWKVGWPRQGMARDAEDNYISYGTLISTIDDYYWLLYNSGRRKHLHLLQISSNEIHGNKVAALQQLNRTETKYATNLEGFLAKIPSSVQMMIKFC